MKDYFSEWDERNDERLESNYWGNTSEIDSKKLKDLINQPKKDEFVPDEDSKGKQISFEDISNESEEAE